MRPRLPRRSRTNPGGPPAGFGSAHSRSRSPAGPGGVVYVAGSGKAACLFVIREDGTGKGRLTASGYPKLNPAYSPDGKRIAFSSARGANEDVYVMNADGRNVRRLTSHTAPDAQPAWSPDGKRIAFVSMRAGNFKIYVMNANGSRERLLTTGPRRVTDSSPSWSPDGRWTAFSSSRVKDGNPEIFKMRRDGSGVTRLTFTDTAGEVPTARTSVGSPVARRLSGGP